MKAKQKFTLLHRLLHWIMALAMMILLITGFLRMKWMNKHHIVDIISEKTDLLPKETMTDIATTIRSPMWEWHVIFAYVFILAFIIRIVYMITKGIRFPKPFSKGISIKERLQGLTYVYFYLYGFMAVVTGVIIRQGFFPDMKKDIEAVHKWGLYLVPIFLILHIIGVVMAENSTEKGITSKMIGGEMDEK